jgi:hypothetical protein
MTWKLAMPPAEQWQDLTQSLDKAKPVKGEGKVLIKGNDKGMRWKLNPEVLERVGVVLGVMYTITVGTIEDFIDEYNRLGYAQLEFHQLESFGGAFGYKITVNPNLSPEAANYSIWHEIQHMFQLEEGRFKGLTYDPTNMNEEEVAKYRVDPTEIDADQMALQLHSLQQYATVVTISMYEGSEGDYYRELIEEQGWPEKDAQEELGAMVEHAEIPLSTVMATRGLDAVSKVAMPYYNNVWYHVTSIDNLDSISKQGLTPRMESGQSTNWPTHAVAENAVYLWPTISLARAYFGALPFKEREVILRITNIDQSKLAPDHEAFTDWTSQQFYDEKHWPEDTDRTLYREVLKSSPTLQEEVEAVQEDEYMDLSYEAGLHILAEISPQLRKEIVEYFAQTDPTAPVMYYGTIPPEDIAVASLLTFEQLEEEFIQNNQDHPFLQHPDDRAKPADENELEQDYRDKLDQYLVNIMEDKQIRQFISVEDIEEMIQTAYEDENDEYEEHFTYQPIQEYPKAMTPDYGPTPTPWYKQTPVL